MATVKLKNLEKTYENGHLAVQGINLEILDGEFMVFVGPSGCAKSTTLRMIAGLENISSGQVLINDKIMNDIAPKDRGIAMVFQNYALYPHYTVYENMAFGLKLAKVPKDEIKKRVEEAAKLLELTDYLNKKPKEMSGGQRQRVAVGRAIVRHPDVFLFDEPLSNLDAKLRVHMRVQITQLHQSLKETGKPSTMIYVTHDQVEAMTMGDRICVLNYGKIMQVDTPVNLYNKPANKFVANFIGSPSMNLIKGELLVENENVYIILKENKFLLPHEKAIKLLNDNGRKIWFGLRPEHISTEADSSVSHDISGEISIIEQMGNESYIYFKAFDDEQLIARIPSSVKYQNGAEQTFYFDLNECHIFDFITEKNISL